MAHRLDRPNVIVFFTDQQRWDTTGMHGNPLGLTQPGPSGHERRAFCTGIHLPAGPALRPGHSADRALSEPAWGPFATASPCLKTPSPAHCFGGAGFDTAYIGKWHLGSQEPVPASERGGYHYWLGANLLEFVSDSYDAVLFDGESRRVKLPAIESTH